ncbi:MAG: hypothetical protein HKN30_07205 [Sulfitobacter sp.]|nr:hypothetical protein [Sulfitobacter sp.]
MMQHFLFRLIFTIAALLILGAYLFLPDVFAKRFDMPALGLLALAALPWLGALVESFKIGGVEAKLRAIRAEAEEAADAAAEAREVAEELAISKPKASEFEVGNAANEIDRDEEEREAGAADDAQANGADDGRAETLSPLQDDLSLRQEATGRADPRHRLEMLARTYVKTRKAMPSGAPRTARMTTIFAEMQQEARHLADDTTVRGWLKSDDEGQQLAAVAWLRCFPEAVPPSRYIALIRRSTQPFVQYWAMRALSGRISAKGLEGFSIEDQLQLQQIENMFRAGTDRHTQIRRLNRKLSGLSAAD